MFKSLNPDQSTPDYTMEKSCDLRSGSCPRPATSIERGGGSGSFTMAGSSVRLERPSDERNVAGSNPALPTIKRDGEVWYLVGLISRRTRVQIPLPLPHIQGS